MPEATKLGIHVRLLILLNDTDFNIARRMHQKILISHAEAQWLIFSLDLIDPFFLQFEIPIELVSDLLFTTANFPISGFVAPPLETDGQRLVLLILDNCFQGIPTVSNFVFKLVLHCKSINSIWRSSLKFSTFMENGSLKKFDKSFMSIKGHRGGLQQEEYATHNRFISVSTICGHVVSYLSDYTMPQKDERRPPFITCPSSAGNDTPNKQNSARTFPSNNNLQRNPSLGSKKLKDSPTIKTGTQPRGLPNERFSNCRTRNTCSLRHGGGTRKGRMVVL
ncbi:hypothetical protein AGLY_008413 [Aphis glycines]|uniref:Uncharacterized protein n=1 Tax=Aphis glycines TaxID=307491 RepID=A0A6G0TM70_APHGL|nr:hypothetical protein AGLY_008413 [Aphis glycines]